SARSDWPCSSSQSANTSRRASSSGLSMIAARKSFSSFIGRSAVLRNNHPSPPTLAAALLQPPLAVDGIVDQHAERLLQMLDVNDPPVRVFEVGVRIGPDRQAAPAPGDDLGGRRQRLVLGQFGALGADVAPVLQPGDDRPSVVADAEAAVLA